MPKIHDILEGYHAFWCPGCNRTHAVHSFGHKVAWEFNGDYKKPTFKPSILVQGTKPISDDEAERIMRGEHFVPIPWQCHSFVTDGKIQFLSDCSHELAGQTVEIPDWDGDAY